MSIFQNTKIAFQHKTDFQLKKAYYLFRFMHYPMLTKLGNSLLNIMVKYNFPMIQTIVKQTIFEQFCGGETQEESLPIIDTMYKNKVYSILDYSVEGKQEEKIFDETCEEIISIIKFSHQSDAMPFSVFKPTGFGRFELYEKMNKNEYISESEKEEWNRVLNRFERVANAAYDANITIMIDAEESWIQDAIDRIAEQLMRKYNTQKCVICNTLQMYRHDRLDYLKQQYEIAKEKKFMLGFKVVRGAYMEKERDRAIQLGYESPINPTKEATDALYNEAVEFILQHINTISLYAGTHNEESCERIIQHISTLHISKNYHKVWFGQLYGMSDNLSFNLGANGYNIAKYLPYGPIKEVVPYLTRRATENSSVSGQTGRELQLIIKELKRRKQEKK